MTQYIWVEGMLICCLKLKFLPILSTKHDAHLKKNYNHVHKEAAVHMLIEKSLVLNSSKV